MGVMDLEWVTSCDICASGALVTRDSAISLCQCTDCGFLFRSPRPTLAAIAQYYSRDTQYNHWLVNQCPRDALWRRRLRLLECYGRTGRLLDVGTGIGEFLACAVRCFEVEGTEVSWRAAEIAQTRYGLKIRHGTLDQIDFGAKRFDVVTIFHVLEHVHSPRLLLMRCRELLVDNGLLVIAVPNETRSWKRLPKIVLASSGLGRFRDSGFGLKPLALDKPGMEIHLSHFTPRTLQVLLARCGFRPIDEAIDPCHATTGLSRIVHDGMYHSCRWAYRIIGLNFGEALWVAAVKQTLV